MYFHTLNCVGVAQAARLWWTDRQTDRTAFSNSAVWQQFRRARYNLSQARLESATFIPDAKLMDNMA